MQFQVGDRVLLKLQPYAQSSLVNRPFPKIAHKFFGPYTVLERVDVVAYRLDLPPASLIHLVFHISQLKEYHPNVFSELPIQVDFSKEMLQPELVLKRRLVKKGNAVVPRVRVKWFRLPESASTWED
jgi:hypothetical protein